MAQKGVLNFSALGKIFTIVLLQNVCNFRATVGVSAYNNNGSTYSCPSFGKITLRWHEFHPFTHYNSSSKALEGNLKHYMRKALNICCPNLEIIHEKVDINSSCEMEILIRQTAPDEPRVYFPIFANRGDGEQFERRFLGLFDSPGPAILKLNHGITSSANEILYFLKNVWAIVVISFLHAVLAGMIIWYLVRTSKLFFNPCKIKSYLGRVGKYENSNNIICFGFINWGPLPRYDPAWVRLNFSWEHCHGTSTVSTFAVWFECE